MSRTPIMLTALESWPIELLILSTIQSNNLEYTVFDKASRLKAAASGSRGLVMLPSGVTMTRLQSESSSAFASHMNNSAAVWRWKSDLSSFNFEESTSFPLTKSMFPRWRIAATTRKIASCSSWLMPTISIAFLVSKYSFASSTFDTS
ncbi:hypothetical protein V8G54_027076 [Vigna mungo]|uniref:Uncharacterized protein n=1 Tax=Vigna mungo TaxID=3915 RepID=A0AAQ3RNR6_VIGMU